MNYATNIVNYQADKGKIIFTGLGIWGNGNSSINEKKNKFLSNHTVYAGNVRFNNAAKVNLAKQYYVVDNVKTEIDGYYYNNRKISGLTGDKTTFVLTENSYIYANQLRIFIRKNSYLNNKGTIDVVANKEEIGVMSIKADSISNKHIISALGAIKDNEYIIPSSINITTKHLINHQDADIKAS
ncbi:hypothetical protein [Arsenophonus endosymbiont of Aleurodicus floccissimus]|uniref:hypothetical protein n=1 Tax=Arsenophonus endosymbiont of Aleurodicus floccissimus TaxID=2152761 RepID=UPI0011C44212|nr:hypothetical protein [Arsenophonus endosymbiont of Aleurodicus floccissimus]